jgi:hypothetical protein
LVHAGRCAAGVYRIGMTAQTADGSPLTYGTGTGVVLAQV